MNWIDTNTLITICTCAIGLTQFLFWRYIAKQKSYEAEKGKNIATKEDIAGITEEIKSVESKFINETEELKAELTLLTNIKTGLFSEKRNCIIDFNSELNIWLQSVISFGNTRSTDNDSIYRRMEDITNIYNNFQTKYATFKIYIEDYDLKMAINTIIKNGLEANKLIHKCFWELIDTNIDIDRLIKTDNDSGLRILYDKRKDILANYYNEAKTLHQELFQEICLFEEGTIHLIV